MVIADAPAPVPAVRNDDIGVFFDAFCIKCHNEEKHKGGVNLHELKTFTLENAQHWHDVLHNLQRGDMPPEDEKQPSDEGRRHALSLIHNQLDRLNAKNQLRDFRFLRLSNAQIANSLKDVLRIPTDYREELIGDPVGKHGESVQSTLFFGGAHYETYLVALQKAVAEAIPDPAQQPDAFSLRGNDWEKAHYLNRNDLAHGSKRRHRIYTGPRWLEDKFQIPLPPDHFFRIYINDNRQQGEFRARIHLRNEPPQKGGGRKQQAMSLFLDKGFKDSEHPIGNIVLEAKPGTQVFELFGNIADFPGVDPSEPGEGEDLTAPEAYFRYRFLTVRNCSPLKSASAKKIKITDWPRYGYGHFIRADDQWIEAWGEAFGKENWLKRSHAGSHHSTKKHNAFYKRVMGDTSHAVIEKIEFDLPWQWPARSVAPYLEDGAFTNAAITREVLRVASMAWRRVLDADEESELKGLIAGKLAAAESKQRALQSILLDVLSDARFLFYTDVETDQKKQNFELVARLAAFLWRSVPDAALLELADKSAPVSDRELDAQVTRMLAHAHTDRFLEDFTSNWIAFDKLDQIAVNPSYYEAWAPKHKIYMKKQSVAFFAELLHRDLSCLNCLSSDFMVVNDYMARFYGVPLPESGHAFSRIPAPPMRGGVLTQSAFLLAHGTGDDAHAVNRGVWVRSRLLGDPVREPPPEVPALDDIDKENPDAVKLSTKDRLALHRKGICLDCHKDVDPWGVAMESYGAIGEVRKKILSLRTGKASYLPLDDAAQIGGVPVKGMAALKTYLRKHHAEAFGRSFTIAMTSFALGRKLDYHENDMVADISSSFKDSNYKMETLIRAVVRHPVFQRPDRMSE